MTVITRKKPRVSAGLSLISQQCSTSHAGQLTRVQAKGGPVREIRAGDVVWIPPGEKHWHGGSPTNAMTHLAMQESIDGSAVTWMEHVTDAEYAVKVG